MAEPTDPAPVLRSGAEERDYLLKRAEAHLHMAETARELGSRAIHLRLSRLYREQAELVAIVLPD
jgi:hypothetical protein